MTAPTVFISYSHDSPAHADRVLALSNRLRADGVDCTLDQYELAPPEGWPRWMDKHIRTANFVLMICTETYLRRVMGEEKPGTGLGIKWEGNLIYNRIYQADTSNTRFIPVLFDGGAVEHIPTPLQGASRYRLPQEYEDLYRRLTNQPLIQEPELGKLRQLPSRERRPDYLDIKVSLSKLPSTSSDLFGRENELATLDAAWDSAAVIASREAAKQSPPNLEIASSSASGGLLAMTRKVNVLSLVAWGGVGKTALVNKWLSLMAADRVAYRGAERVFGWSFYSQGAVEGRQVSADQFIAAALKWFGDPQMAESAASPWDKGERLAELVRQSRTLLVLDGLEPLQNPPPVETGCLKDPALSTLLRELARHNPGLVAITTRLAVDNLKDFRDGASKQIDLETLSDIAGAAYLKHLGVAGTDAERQKATDEYRGHALALTLLGRYLVDVYEGDVRKRDLIPRLTDEEEQGAHAKRIINAYDAWFRGKPEQNILYVLGLFDRPADKGAIKAITDAPVIAGLTDHLQDLSREKWKRALKHLNQARLIADRDPYAADTLDCHPLLREYFGEQLRTSNPKAWREAHSRLYEYYKTSVKELPDTLEEMAPLFAAVAHGCQSGQHQEVYDEVYRKRTRRGNEFFSTKRLGAFGADLAAVSGFFDPPWQKPVDGLREESKVTALAIAGFDLRALGRLAESAQPMQAAVEAAKAREDWKNAAAGAGNLSELYLTIGDLAQALDYAHQSAELADCSGDAFQRMGKRTTLADALHQAGRLPEAEAAFREAEEMQKARQPQFPLLYSLPGFQYCDLLLSQGKYQEVQSRTSQTLEWVKNQLGLLSVALNYLSLGRAYLQEATLTRASRSLSLEGRGVGGEGARSASQAATHLQRAVDGLRQAGQQDDLPRGLLARAELHSFAGDFTRGQNDLDEAFTIATRGGMRLHEADCHLEYARLYLAQGKKDQAREHLAKAKALIEQTGYHRRDGEVKEIEAMINGQ
jgi:tetratricopeptide (TPR) repeat protein